MDGFREFVERSTDPFDSDIVADDGLVSQYESELWLKESEGVSREISHKVFHSMV